MEQVDLTALQKAIKKYYEKIKNKPNYIERRRGHDDAFEEKVSNYKRQYYMNKKEILLENIAQKF